jgi:hypothetical protein
MYTRAWFTGIIGNCKFETEMRELIRGKAEREGWYEKKEFAVLDLDEFTLADHLHVVFVSKGKSRRAVSKVLAKGGGELVKVTNTPCSLRVCC